MPHIVLLVVQIIVVIAAAAWLTQQVRKPSGWLGRRVVRIMNATHSSMTNWRLQELGIAKNATILDVGCGGGRTVAKLSALAPEGKLYGLDYSPASVAVSRATNAAAITAGRVQIEHGPVAALPFPDQTFDLVTAVETHYYWPELPSAIREIFRVPKPGGAFTQIAETYSSRPSLLHAAVMPLIRARFLSDAEHREILTHAGFAEATTRQEPGKTWICASGRRPA